MRELFVKNIGIFEGFFSQGWLHFRKIELINAVCSAYFPIYWSIQPNIIWERDVTCWRHDHCRSRMVKNQLVKATYLPLRAYYELSRGNALRISFISCGYKLTSSKKYTFFDNRIQSQWSKVINGFVQIDSIFRHLFSS